MDSRSATAGAAGDDAVRRLVELFRAHPVWCQAARRIQEGSASRVFFPQWPGEPWRLVRRGGTSVLEPGDADDPDLAFCFPPAAVEQLESTRGAVGDFALALFRLMLDADPARRVELRVIAPFPRLLRRGYVELLLRGGPRLLWFGATHGVRSVADLRRVVDSVRSSEPAPWETVATPQPSQR